MENLKELTLNFKEKTVEMLECFKTEDYDRLNSLLGDRQTILDIIMNNPNEYSKDDLVKCFQGTDIVRMDKEVEKLIKENLSKIQDKLHSIGREEFIKKKYGSNLLKNPIFFNKKIY